jgi:hypothetical protein
MAVLYSVPPKVQQYLRELHISLPGEVREYFVQTGSIGGKRRAALHSKAELRAWGKLGGRPRKDGSHSARPDKKGGK